jgi:hypothetical protein
MQALQTDIPLMISGLIEHAAAYHADTEIVARAKLDLSGRLQVYSARRKKRSGRAMR